MAENILSLDFPENDAACAAQLNETANEGTLTEAERDELQVYADVADLLAYWQLKARQALQRNSRPSWWLKFAVERKITANIVLFRKLPLGARFMSSKFLPNSMAPHAARKSCARVQCNSKKGTNLTSIGPETGELTRLFHPRTDTWTDHFASRMLDSRVGRIQIVGLTAIGRGDRATS